ncbi:hypothetical protein SRIMM317S_02883 [Streptomyces rimosus subsp. rimosus]
MPAAGQQQPGPAQHRQGVLDDIGGYGGQRAHEVGALLAEDRHRPRDLADPGRPAVQERAGPVGQDAPADLGNPVGADHARAGALGPQFAQQVVQEARVAGGHGPGAGDEDGGGGRREGPPYGLGHVRLGQRQQAQHRGAAVGGEVGQGAVGRGAAREDGALGLPGEDDEQGQAVRPAQQEVQPAQGEFVTVVDIVQGQDEGVAAQLVRREAVQVVERALYGGGVRRVVGQRPGGQGEEGAAGGVVAGGVPYGRAEQRAQGV